MTNITNADGMSTVILKLDPWRRGGTVVRTLSAPDPGWMLPRPPSHAELTAPVDPSPLTMFSFFARGPLTREDAAFVCSCQRAFFEGGSLNDQDAAQLLALYQHYRRGT